jgi:hypothetical protein
VFDLKLELLIANEHLKALLAQNEVLKQALNERLKQKGQAPLPAAPLPAQPQQPQQPQRSAQEELALSIKAHKNLLFVLKYLTDKYGREKDFLGLALIQQRLADLYQSAEKPQDAIQLYKDRLDTAQRQLEWVRDEKRAVSDARSKLEINALKAKLRYEIELGQFYYSKLIDNEQALEAARKALKFRETEAKLADDEDLRFFARRLIIACLVRLNRQDEALAEATNATADMLAAARKGLGSALASTANSYRDIANYFNDIGLRGRAMATANDLAVALEFESRSPLQPTSSNLTAAANLNLSWLQLLNRKYAEAQATAEKSLVLDLDESMRGELNVKRAHALLLLGKVDQAKEIYESWKLKRATASSSLGSVVFRDLGVLEKLGLLDGIEGVAAIRASMDAPR